MNTDTGEPEPSGSASAKKISLGEPRDLDTLPLDDQAETRRGRNRPDLDEREDSIRKTRKPMGPPLRRGESRSNETSPTDPEPEGR